MYIFQETKTIPSDRAPGVEYVFRNMTEDRRLELQKAIAGPNAKIRKLLTEVQQVRSMGDNGTTEIMRLNDEMQMVITEELNPAKVRWGLSAIKGLYIGSENNPATLDNLMRWPSPIIEEVLSIVDEGSALSEPAAKNFGSSTTSGAVEETTQNSTTASAAGEVAGS